jgi:GntR family transcriptional regulator
MGGSGRALSLVRWKAIDTGGHLVYNDVNDTKIQYIFDTWRVNSVNVLAGKIKLDFRSSEPLYLQIARQVEQLVAKGDLKLGDQLPTVRELATELRINFNTVSRAYRMLDETRLISTQRGRGTYIWEQPTEETMKQLKKKSLEELARSFQDEITRLGYGLDEAIEELKRVQPAESPNGPEHQPEDKEQ